MPRESYAIQTLNRGMVSPLAIARTDLKRVGLSAELQSNWMPRVVGSAMLRPGLQYIGQTVGGGKPKLIPFIFSTVDTSILEINGTNQQMRIWINDQLLTFAPVLTTVSNPTFNALVNWVNHSEAGGSVSYSAGPPGFGAYFTSNGYAAAIIDQEVIPSIWGVEHCMEVQVGNGPVTVFVGSSQGDDSYVRQTALETGIHFLAFTPMSNIWIRFQSTQVPSVCLTYCQIFSGSTSTVLNIPVPWTVNDLGNLRWDQSGDVVFIACEGYQQRRIERRGNAAPYHSYSLVYYKTLDGPFQLENTTEVTLTPSGTSGNITVTSSRPLFRPSPSGYSFTGPDGQRGDAGGLLQLVSGGQNVSATLSGVNQFTPYIEVSGAGTARNMYVTITGLTGTGTTVTLQQSVGIPGVWVDTVPATNYGANQSSLLLNDGATNQIVYWRLGIEAGNYSTGTPIATLTIAAGSITGNVRILDVINTTQVEGEVIPAGVATGGTSFGQIGGTNPVSTWSMGNWSDTLGWPSSVLLYEGRMWWAGQNGIFGSVPDNYTSYDPTVLGDGGPINRTIGSGPVDQINWFVGLQRLIMGSEGSEFSIRSDALDDVLTPSNFNIKTIGGQGSTSLPALKIDQKGLFVNRTGTRAYDLAFSFQFYDYAATEATAIVPEILRPGVVRIALQRQPDTRIHFVRSDGVVVVQVTDPAEEVSAFIEIQTNGIVEDVIVLPAVTGNYDDQVYYVVARTINGQTVRYIEKWAQEAQCKGDQQLCCLADSYVSQTFVTPTSTITGLSNLAGQQVVVWADGMDVGTTSTGSLIYTVSSAGTIQLAVPASNVVVGLPYMEQFQSVKLGLATAQETTPLTRRKTLDHVGLILANYYPGSLSYGTDFQHLDPMPLVEQGLPVTGGAQLAYDNELIPLDGTWTTDARLCLQASAPRPCTLLAAVISMSMS